MSTIFVASHFCTLLASVAMQVGDKFFFAAGHLTPDLDPTRMPALGLRGVIMMDSCGTHMA